MNKSQERLLETAKKRFATADGAAIENRREALADIHFVAGEQWPEDVKSQRGKDVVTLTINRTQAMVKQVVNEQRQNRPAVRVRPVDDQGDKIIADVIEGLVRNIEAQSQAESVYDYGFEQAVGRGYGYWRVTTEYCDEDSFDQEVRVRRVRNPFDILFDPQAEDYMKEDARYCFASKRLDKKEFRKKYPNADSSKQGFETMRVEGWWDEESVRLAEYFYKEKREKLLVLFDDGSVIAIPEQIGGDKVDPAEYIDLYSRENEVERVRERVSEYDVVKWCLLNGVEVLKQQDWPGRYIPIVPVYGDEIDIEGKVTYAGLTRYMRDPQRMYNYWITKATESVALSPKQKILVTAEQIGSYQRHWDRANTDNRMYLPYNYVNGQPTPHEIQQAQLPTGIAQLLMMSSDQMKEVSGIYDASLGARSNETSGIAIQQRQQQGSIANFHFMDNLNRSIAYTGRILVDLIPRIYDTERAVRILGEDGSTDIVTLQSTVKDGSGQPVTKNGKPLLYDLSVGKYDVSVEAGPGYATKRQEAFDYMLQLVQASPELMGVIGDLLFLNSDLPHSDEIAERLKGAMGQTQGEIPPGMAGMPPGGAPPGMMPQ